TKKLRVRSRHVETIPPHGHTFVRAAHRRARTHEMPNLKPCAGINGPNLITARNVEDSAHLERHRLQVCGMSLKCPGERKRAHVIAIDLLERAEAATGIVAVVGRPVRRQLQKMRGIKPLTPQTCRENRREEDYSQKPLHFHFKVSR